MTASVSIVDVAAYILARESTMVTLKLHKLAFYAQAAHLVRHASPSVSRGFSRMDRRPCVPRALPPSSGQALDSTRRTALR